jgi:hypothetical protein
MSSWRWPSPSGIAFVAASVHGPAGVAAWRGVAKRVSTAAALA